MCRVLQGVGLWGDVLTGLLARPPTVQTGTCMNTLALTPHVVRTVPAGESVLLVVGRDHTQEPCAWLVHASADGTLGGAVRAGVRCTLDRASDGLVLKGVVPWSAPSVLVATEVLAVPGHTLCQVAGKRPLNAMPLGAHDRYTMLQALVSQCGDVPPRLQFQNTDMVLQAAWQRGVAGAPPKMQQPDTALEFIPTRPCLTPALPSQCRVWCRSPRVRLLLACRWPAYGKSKERPHDAAQWVAAGRPAGVTSGPRVHMWVRVLAVHGGEGRDCLSLGAVDTHTGAEVHLVSSALLEEQMQRLCRAVPTSTRRSGGVAIRSVLPDPWRRVADAQCGAASASGAALTWSESTGPLDFMHAPCLVVDARLQWGAPEDGKAVCDMNVPGFRRVSHPTVLVHPVQVSGALTQPGSFGSFLRGVYEARAAHELDDVWTTVTTGGAV